MPNNIIEVTVKFPVEKVVDETIKKDVQQTVIDAIEKNNFDAKSIQVNVMNHFSKTQNYSDQVADLLPYIGISLSEKGYSLSLDHNFISNKQVEITIKLALEKIDANTKREVQQTANDVIEKYNFNAKSFQINVTNYEEN